MIISVDKVKAFEKIQHPFMTKKKKPLKKVGTKGTCVHSQLCLTLCDSMDGSPPGSSVHRIFPGRIVEWVTISFSN